MYTKKLIWKETWEKNFLVFLIAGGVGGDLGVEDSSVKEQFVFHDAVFGTGRKAWTDKISTSQERVSPVGISPGEILADRAGT